MKASEAKQLSEQVDIEKELKILLSLIEDKAKMGGTNYTSWHGKKAVSLMAEQLRELGYSVKIEGGVDYDMMRIDWSEA